MWQWCSISSGLCAPATAHLDGPLSSMLCSAWLQQRAAPGPPWACVPCTMHHMTLVCVFVFVCFCDNCFDPGWFNGCRFHSGCCCCCCSLVHTASLKHSVPGEGRLLCFPCLLQTACPLYHLSLVTRSLLLSSAVRSLPRLILSQLSKVHTCDCTTGAMLSIVTDCCLCAWNMRVP